ncbi:hypothetical protein [Algicola sagamiensis]|uniref:hypothetical protein n=1 Tax=Algicola sagamiensis TaxID=163869 RepID=UPI00036FE5AE|nr:hypothetical protein [Algicola sagamiensis]
MKSLLLAILILGGVYFYMNQVPSTPLASVPQSEEDAISKKELYPQVIQFTEEQCRSAQDESACMMTFSRMRSMCEGTIFLKQVRFSRSQIEQIKHRFAQCAIKAHLN